jgi:signal transduction histidine kinase
MRLRRKMIVHHFRQLLLFFVVLIVVLVISLALLGYQLTKREMATDLSLLSASDLSLFFIAVDKNGVRVDEDVEHSVKNQNGWLQVIDRNGEAVYAYNCPPDVPRRYTPGELVGLAQPESGFPHHTRIWTIRSGEESYLVLYGTPAPEVRLLHLVLPREAGENAVSRPAPGSEVQEAFRQHNAWLAVYDRQGSLVEQWNNPQAAKRLEAAEILQAEQERRSRPVNIISRYDEATGRTFVVGVPNPLYRPGTSAAENSDRLVQEALLKIVLILVLVVLAAALWYGRRVGQPLLHMMNWLEQLANGRYQEPTGRNGRLVGTTRRGRRKKSFAVFQDIFDALQHLTAVLSDSERRRKDMERTREEWITGLSHDLKTPLSSIYGYAAILESDQYEWGPGEIRRFGGIIREKADYMTGLIEDLNLTYRLKNKALPMVKKTAEIVEQVRRIVVDTVNDPGTERHVIRFQPEVASLLGQVDGKWFRRIVANVLANAVKHTPPGTNVLVSVGPNSGGGFVVKVADDGPGMDEETKENLFERYYRGGHTQEDASGSGLGMAIAKQLVLAHGGEIRVESEPGRGTTVAMLFPPANDLKERDEVKQERVIRSGC